MLLRAVTYAAAAAVVVVVGLVAHVLVNMVMGRVDVHVDGLTAAIILSYPKRNIYLQEDCTPRQKCLAYMTRIIKFK